VSMRPLRRFRAVEPNGEPRSRTSRCGFGDRRVTDIRAPVRPIRRSAGYYRLNVGLWRADAQRARVAGCTAARALVRVGSWPFAQPSSRPCSKGEHSWTSRAERASSSATNAQHARRSPARRNACAPGYRKRQRPVARAGGASSELNAVPVGLLRAAASRDSPELQRQHRQQPGVDLPSKERSAAQRRDDVAKPAVKQTDPDWAFQLIIVGAVLCILGHCRKPLTLRRSIADRKREETLAAAPEVVRVLVEV
jgi:hypothetical protein